MSKTMLTPITVMKLTVVGRNGRVSSKRVSKAVVAADFYATQKWHQWWTDKGHKHVGPDRYPRSNSYLEKLYRRALPVFKKYLP